MKQLIMVVSFIVGLVAGSAYVLLRKWRGRTRRSLRWRDVERDLQARERGTRMAAKQAVREGVRRAQR